MRALRQTMLDAQKDPTVSHAERTVNHLKYTKKLDEYKAGLFPRLKKKLPAHEQLVENARHDRATRLLVDPMYMMLYQSAMAEINKTVDLSAIKTDAEKRKYANMAFDAADKMIGGGADEPS
ncbi:hypothetical protein MM326_06820 [Alkalihalobacillus sp. LMS6]|uniref:hypothetical protein n=1 Tax=Alkalihalobacillus sp. LMS6 TaxID=2924034 RepID=UPI0020D070D9|nr:hypothetical protein [Alkalihalobacillus sp. LMS6]UTR07720.1 hypothetical protein MM326_06820 [Alkalihalobacillus sp. LMS6]